MPVYIHHIETAVPPTSYRQDYVRDFMKAHTQGDRRTGSLLHRVYSHSGIEKRHSVIEDLRPEVENLMFFQRNGSPDSLETPSTAKRNRIYTEQSKPMFTGLAQKVIDRTEGIEAKDITHVITVSCTGFYAPGPDYIIVRQLGLRPSTRRFHIGFMGCYAAFPAIRLAKNICESEPNASVLIVCLELCSLHFKFSDVLDLIVSGSVFADGAAGLIVSGQTPSNLENTYEVKGLETTLTETGEDDMAWTIGDNGFEMVLSSYVPRIIKENIRGVVRPLFNAYGMDKADVAHWALHPGGRAIVDKAEQSLELDDQAFRHSRKVLANYGNMSSATVLFVLKEILRTPPNTTSEPTLGMAFGPGLTIESGLFLRNPA